MAQAIEWSDVQGLVLRAYREHPHGCYLRVRLPPDPPAAKAWLAGLLPHVTRAEPRPRAQEEEGAATASDPITNVAFTAAGLRALGLEEEACRTFADAFREGMSHPHRSAALGDVGVNAPERWTWGADPGAVHALLVLFAPKAPAARAHEEDVRRSLEAAGADVDGRIEAYLHPKGREHFGFRDGISEPVLPDTRRAALEPDAVVKAGEFLFGYPNAYGAVTPSPFVSRDPHGLLPPGPDPAGGAHRDLGRNGSLLVVRQLRQEVGKLEAYAERAAGALSVGPSDPQRRAHWVQAKMVGRWPSGAPLSLAPGCDRPELADENRFGFAGTDRHGLACPLGAHIRRANPRDSLGADPVESRAVVDRHRILRRGRLYGPRFSPETADDDRGLTFLCLNVNLERQFEFVQRTWINGSRFAGLRGELDPLVGAPGPDRAFTIQSTPVDTRLPALSDFVRVVGGGYFFLPGLRALAYLSR